MADPTCTFLNGHCPKIAVDLWRYLCPSCGSFRVRQLCLEHSRQVAGRVEGNLRIRHDEDGKGCQQRVGSKDFYTYMGGV